jgi:tetratricopeptide (TPR) repeat protein
VILLLLMVSSLRLFVADVLSRGSSVQSREAAIKLIPGNVTYILSLADLHRQQDADVRADLVHATRADPDNYRLYVQLGLEYERVGDYRSASACLQQAARLSREFLAPWTLANYYFRRGDMPQFLFWIRRALEAGPPDPTAAFHLLGQSGATPSEIDAAIPRTAQVLMPYLSWLMSQNHPDLARPVAATILSRFPAEGRDLLVSYCGLLAAGNESQRLEAVQLWNGLCARGLLHEKPVFPARPPDVVDPRLREVQDHLALGWQQVTDQVLVSRVDRGLFLSFDGNQPEQCSIIAELVSIQPARRYAFESSYESDLPADNGVSWRIEDAQSNAPLQTGDAFLAGDAHEVNVPFTTPENCRFVRLILQYARQPGTVRVSGSVLLTNVDLKPSS